MKPRSGPGATDGHGAFGSAAGSHACTAGLAVVKPALSRVMASKAVAVTRVLRKRCEDRCGRLLERPDTVRSREHDPSVQRAPLARQLRVGHVLRDSQIPGGDGRAAHDGLLCITQPAEGRVLCGEDLELRVQDDIAGRGGRATQRADAVEA